MHLLSPHPLLRFLSSPAQAFRSQALQILLRTIALDIPHSEVLLESSLPFLWVSH